MTTIKPGTRVQVNAPYVVYGYTVKKSWSGVVTGQMTDGLLTVQERPDRNHQPVPVDAVTVLEVTNGRD